MANASPWYRCLVSGAPAWCRVVTATVARPDYEDGGYYESAEQRVEYARENDWRLDSCPLSLAEAAGLVSVRREGRPVPASAEQAKEIERRAYAARRAA